MNKILKIVFLSLILIGVFQQVYAAAPIYRLERSILPETTDTYYLGSTSPDLEWNNIYTKNINVSGTGTTTFGGNLDLSGNLRVRGNSQLDISLFASGNATVGNTLTASNVVATSTTATSTFSGGVVMATGGGNVGIGIATPAVAVEAVGTIRASRSGTASQYIEISAGLGNGPILTGAGTAKTLTISNTSTGGISLNTNGGGQALFIADTGNTGIGTTTPSAKISITGSGTGTGRAFVIANSSNAEKLSVLDNGLVTVYSNIVAGTADNIDIGTAGSANRFRTAYLSGGISSGSTAGGISVSAESNGAGAGINFNTGSPATAKVAITNTGLTGIGSTTPSATLGVQGSALISGNITSVANITATGTVAATEFDAGGTNATRLVAGALFFGSSANTISASGSNILYGAGNTVNHIFQGTGNVGIGTSSPYVKFAVQSTSGAREFVLANTAGNVGMDIRAGATSFADIRLSDEGGAFSGISYDMSNDRLNLHNQSSTPRLTVTSTGLVGIGTTTPTAALTLNESTASTGGIRFGSDMTFYRTNNRTLNIDSTDGSARVALYGKSNGTDKWEIYSDSAQMYVSTIANLPLKFRTNSIERMMLDTSGNLAIGTTTPYYPLTVKGDAYFASSTANVAAGIILQDSDRTSTCHRITVNSVGTLAAAAVACPNQ